MYQWRFFSIYLVILFSVRRTSGEDEGNYSTPSNVEGYRCPTTSRLGPLRNADRGTDSSATLLGLDSQDQYGPIVKGGSQAGLNRDNRDLRIYGSLPLTSQLACIEPSNSTDVSQLLQGLLISRQLVGAAFNQSERNEENTKLAPTGPLVLRDRMEAIWPLFNISSAASLDVDSISGTQPTVCMHPIVLSCLFTSCPGREHC